MSDTGGRRHREMLVPLDIRTYRIAIINGILAMVGIRMADEGTIVPLLMHRLTGAAWVVGLTLALCITARTVTQLLAARHLDSLPYKKPFYVLSAIVRMLSLLAVCATLYWARDIGMRVAAIVVLVALLGRSVGGAFANLSFMDIVAKSVPTTRRGSLWQWRRMIGLTIVAVVVAPFVRYLTGPESPFPFPVNFGVLFATSVGVMAVAWLAFSAVNEPPSRPASRHLDLWRHLVSGVRLVRRDQSYRRLIRARLLLGCAAAIRPFFVVFGSEVWGLSDQTVATFLGVQVIAEIAGSFVSGRTSDVIGNRRGLLIASASMVVAAAIGVIAAWGSWNYQFALGPWQASMRVTVLSAAFVASGFFLACLLIGSMNYTMDIAPERKRPSYMAFLGAFTLPLAVMPLLYGWAADVLGYRVVFGAGLLLAVVSLVFSLALPEPRDELDSEQLAEYL
ncbi:MAG: MFS transporter [Armatimonadetes bacterium]|nr:MFS transporter [Armatimonadota bacterium]